MAPKERNMPKMTKIRGHLGVRIDEPPKAVAIAIHSINDTMRNGIVYRTVVLGDNGRVYVLSNNATGGYQWVALPPLPMDE